MRLKGRQGRFLGLVIGGWCAARIILLWPHPPLHAAAATTIAGARQALAWPAVPVEPIFAALPPTAERPAARLAAGSPIAPAARWDAPLTKAASFSHLFLLAVAGGDMPPVQAMLRRAVYARSAFPGDAPSPPPSAGPGRTGLRRLPPRIEAQAFLFLRPGSGQALAAGTSLGGSQAAARIAVPLDRAGHLAAAARVYAPLAGKGAEAAAGLDWRPAPDLPLRVSVERRQGLDAAGRSAWSAYVAGGVWRALPGGFALDGYGQAGVVGLRSRDLFADGAVRIVHPVTTGPFAVEIGGGAWGAAQPGARRLDIGPRAVIHLPVADHGLSLALEGRFRVAGNARPGSGAVLTLAAGL